jgi:hypothetical protein
MGKTTGTIKGKIQEGFRPQKPPAKPPVKGYVPPPPPLKPPAKPGKDKE